MSMNFQTVVEAAEDAARSAAKLLCEGFGHVSEDQIRMKGRGDYVTELDRRSEDEIVLVLKSRFPGCGILAEESGAADCQSDLIWIIDPLDGTANYVQNIPMFCISIAAQYNNSIIAGIVYDPIRDEMFSAVQGCGARLNGHRISVSRKKEMSHAMLASGFPWRSKDELDAYLKSFRTLFRMSAGLRRMGAAALDLAYTACGRFDGFWEMHLHPWDIAAGCLLVTEAGGTVSDFSGSSNHLRSGNVVAGNEFIHGCLCEVLRQVHADFD